MMNWCCRVSRSLLIGLLVSVTLFACSSTAPTPPVFIKANPPVDSVLDHHPRTLRVFLTEFPDISKSSLRLWGQQGEISLSRFHTMGADDLMIEIDDHPLPNGKYRVEWTATVGEDERHYTGRYTFTVAVEN